MNITLCIPLFLAFLAGTQYGTEDCVSEKDKQIEMEKFCTKHKRHSLYNINKLPSHRAKKQAILLSELCSEFSDL